MDRGHKGRHACQEQGGSQAERTHNRAESILLIGRTAAALEFDTSALESDAKVAELPDGAIYDPHSVGLLAGASVVVLAPGAGNFSHEARRTCLAALHLQGELPIIASSGADIAAAVSSYASALSAQEPAITAEPRELAAAVNAALLRRAASERSAPFRLQIAGGDPGGADVVVGRPVAGTAEPGLDVVLLPSATSAVVRSVATGPSGEQIVRLDRTVAAAPGQVLASGAFRPEYADQVAAHVVWTADQPLLPGRPYTLRLAGQSATAQVSALKHKINPDNLDPIAARHLDCGEIGLCNLAFDAPLVFDQPVPDRPMLSTSKFTLEEPGTGRVMGLGRILFGLRRATNIQWQHLSVDKTARSHLKGQRPCCLWFTGLSGSGKSTVANLLEKRLNAMGRHTYTLDGDNVRHGLNRDLGFTDADRVENIRRIAEVSKLFVEAGLIVMVSFISPFRAERRMARTLFQHGEFLEIFLDTPIHICESRDPKGLYRKARAGQLINFTGIDSPYETPERAEMRLDSGTLGPETLVEQVLRELTRRGMVDLSH